MTPVDPATLAPVGPSSPSLPALVSVLPAASTDPLAVVLDDLSLHVLVDDDWVLAADDVLQHATAPDGTVHVVQQDGTVLAIRLDVDTPRTTVLGTVPVPGATVLGPGGTMTTSPLSRVAGSEDVSLGVGTDRVVWWDGATRWVLDRTPP